MLGSFLNKKIKTNKGISVVEALLAAALFGLVVTALAGTFLYGETNSFNSGNRTKAVLLAEEGIDAVRNIKEEDFNTLDGLADGTYYLSTSSGSWILGGGSDAIDIFSREIELESIDADTIEVTSRVSWTDLNNRDSLVSLVTRLTNFFENLWIQTTEDEFNNGYRNSVDVVSSSNGEVTLSVEGNWSSPSIFLLENMSGGSDPNGIFMEDNVLWLTRDDNNVYKYDISDISNSNLTEGSSISVSSDALDVVADSQNIYVIRNNILSELASFDKDSGSIQDSVDVLGGNAFNDIEIYDGNIFIGRDSETLAEELYIYDTSLNLIGRVEVGSNVYDIEADSNYVYLATGANSEIWVVDYNDCTGGISGDECSVEETYNPPDGGNSDMSAIHLVGNNLYGGRVNNSIHGFDVSDANSISQFLYTDPGNDEINGIFADENTRYIYVATDDANTEEFAAINIDTSSEINIDLNGLSDTGDISKQGRFIYISSANGNEIQIIEAGQGGWSLPESLDTYNTSGGDNGNDISVVGDYAYLATDDDFWVFDISNPNNIQLEDVIDFNYDINDVFIEGDYAYLATDSNSKELTVVDISTPSNIFETASFGTNGGQNALSVWVDGNYAYIGTANNNGGHSSCTNAEFYILNVSNLGSISCENSRNVGSSVFDIKTNGNYAYLATGVNSQELSVLDISNPTSIILEDTYNTTGNGDAYGLYYDSNKIYLAINNNGGNPDFYVLDVSTPNNVTLDASIDTSTNNRDVVVNGNYAYLATDDNSEGLTIIDISNAGSGSLSQFTGFDTVGDCNGLDFDGTNAFMACETDSQEFIIVGPSGSSTNYPLEGWYTSDEFDSTDNGIEWTQIKWDESGSGDIQFQLRTASDVSGSPGSWTDWLGPTNGDDYYIDNTGGDNINSIHSNGSADRWIQFRAYLTTTSSTTAPILERVVMTYQ